MITSLSLSKFSVVLCPFVLGDNRTFSFFVMFQRMAADRSSIYDEVFGYDSVFKSIFFVSTSVVIFFHGLNRFCTCDVKKHGCWDQFDL